MPLPATASALPDEAPAAARQVGLRYVTDARPGITRKAGPDGFRYFLPDGKPVTDEDELARIRAIAIPPAWTEVWICRWANGHIQATGRDARKRKQYRYHTRWRQVRDEAKYERMIGFAQVLPLIRQRVDQALKLPGLPREKVLATIVYLLQATMMRIGNEEYAKTNKSFGLTTLRNRHVQVDGAEVEFRFKGKSGVQHRISVEDKRLAAIVKRLRDLPGQELFEYIDADGEVRTVDSADVNDYLREVTGEDYTAKDFRTWSGTLLAAMALREFEQVDSETQAKKNLVQAIERVAERLGNTPAVCRKCYIHPGVLDAYLDGSMLESMRQRACEELTHKLHEHSAEEAAVLALLQARLKSEAQAAKAAKAAKATRAAAASGRKVARPARAAKVPRASKAAAA
ncbi:MAG: topoisomerase [Paucimonas sp.]|nr:topoisomerase [Paucimonas sp.]